MATLSRRGRLGLGAAALLLCSGAALIASRSLHRSLETRATGLDLTSLIRGAGLPGRVDPPRWSGARLSWLPRPRLTLSDLETRIHSGLPGPGESAGQVKFSRVLLQPAWDYFWTGHLDRIQVEGGTVRLGRDLLPEPPREYEDPVDGSLRPVPWASFLEIARVAASYRSDTDSTSLGLAARGVFASGPPIVAARRLDLSFLGFELIPDRTFRLDRAQLLIRQDRLDLQGMLCVTERSGAASTIPFLLQQRRSRGGAANLEIRFGPRGSGLRVSVAGGQTSGPVWKIDLADPEGRVATALLEGRAGALRRLRWAGPWRLEVEGNGPFPEGIRRGQVELLSGRFQLAGDSLPVAVARGRLELAPGRVDLRALSLRSPYPGGDSAEIQLSWLRTNEGRNVSGRLDGRIDPAWLALFGEGWSASGRLVCDLGFTGRSFGESGRWEWNPRGTCRGEILRLAGPWFADTLRQGRLEAWAHAGGLGFVAAGAWGESPFRLETRDLPLPGPDYLDLVASGSRWDLRSAECRLEDFRLAAERFPSAGAAPFWLGLPGRGSIRIETGSLGGVPFDRLRASVYRSRGSNRIDSLEVQVAGGMIRNDGPAGPGGGLAGGRIPGETRLRVESLELHELHPLLAAAGLRLPGTIRGRMDGTFRIRWPRPGESADETRMEASLEVRDGLLRDLPAQRSIAQALGASALESISFRSLQVELRRGRGVVDWGRLRVESSPFAVEGAGRISPAWLEGALQVRLAGDGGDSWADLLAGVLGREGNAVYLALNGAPGSPEVKVLTRGDYLRELDALRGATRFGDPFESSLR